MTNNYNWKDNPMVSGVSECNTDIVNDNLMHLKYQNSVPFGFGLDFSSKDGMQLGGTVGTLMMGDLIFNDTLPYSAITGARFLFFANKYYYFNNDAVYISSDGKNYTKYMFPQVSFIYDACVCDGKIILLYKNDVTTNVIASCVPSASNGLSITNLKSTDIKLERVVSNGDVWVACGYKGSKSYAISSFNSNLEDVILDENDVIYTRMDIAYGVYSTPKTFEEVETQYKLFVIIHGDKSYRSYDNGITWDDSTLPMPAGSIGFGNNKFIVLGNSSNKLAYSDDGIIWQEKIVQQNKLYAEYGIITGGNKFIAAFNLGKMMWSDNGIDWRDLPASPGGHFIGTYHNKKFIGVLDNYVTTYIDNRHSTLIDGQWVSHFKKISGASAIGEYTIDLSQELPKDEYNYEVVFFFAGKNTNSTGSYICINTDILTGYTVENISMAAMGSQSPNASFGVTLPVGIERYCIYTIKGHAITADAEKGLFMLGYRRIGTNG